MTVKQLIKRAEELAAKGYGDAELVYINDWERDCKPNLKLNTGYAYRAETFFGSPFDRKSKDFVYIDTDF